MTARSVARVRVVVGATVLALVATGCAITRVSVSSTGTEGNKASSTALGVTDDGRYVLFASEADNLVPSDTNNAVDVFRHDTQTDVTVRVSVSGDEAQLPAGATDAAMNPDARYVAFVTSSPVDPGDTNGTADVYVRDLVDGTTQWASQPPPGGFPVGGAVDAVEISTGGRFVSFLWTTGDVDPLTAWRRDRQLGTTVALAEPDQFADLHAARDAHHYTLDGRCPLLVGPCFPFPEVVDADGSGSGWPPLQFALCPYDQAPAISPDGRYFVFYSARVFGPQGECLPKGVYLVDRTTGAATPLDLRGEYWSFGTQVVAVSRNARAVLYFGDGAIFPGGTEGRRHLYLRDLVNDTDTRPDISLSGQEADADIVSAVLSDDGTYVAFATAATNLIPDDHNGVGDVFVRTTGMPPSP
jgi:TolB protein